MYVGAALEVVAIVAALAVSSATLRGKMLQSHRHLTTSQMNTAITVVRYGDVVVSMIFIGLWLWMSWAIGAGKNWARITGTVFFGIDTLFLLGSFTQPNGAFSLIAGAIGWLLGLAVTILIWTGESKPYFAASKGPRYQ